MTLELQGATFVLYDELENAMCCAVDATLIQYGEESIRVENISLAFGDKFSPQSIIDCYQQKKYITIKFTHPKMEDHSRREIMLTGMSYGEDGFSSLDMHIICRWPSLMEFLESFFEIEEPKKKAKNYSRDKVPKKGKRGCNLVQNDPHDRGA